MTFKRPNGYGTLFTRGNMFWGKWLYHGKLHVMSLGIHVEDKSHSKSALRKMAEEKLNQLTAPYRLASQEDTYLYMKAKLASIQEQLKELRRGNALTCGNAASAYENSPRRNQTTDKRLSYYLNAMNEFADWAGRDTPMAEVSSSMAESYAVELGGKGLAPATFNLKISYLAHVWKILSPAIGSSSENPWNGITKKKTDSVARDTLTDEEIARAVELSRNDYGGDVSLAIVIGANTGLRLGDVANLKWENIDFEVGVIRVKTRKTGVNVHIPLFDELRKELEERIATQKGGTKSGDTVPKNKFVEKTTRIAPGFENFVVPRIAERYNRRSSFASSLMTIAFQKAGIQTSIKTGVGMARPLHGFHSLRATFITRCGVMGIPHQIIMAVVGHSTPEMTQHYTHAKEKEVLEAFSKKD